jgi:RNase P subunit RPR2
MKKLIKKQAENEIKEFFKNIGKKTSKEIRKIKRLAMHHNIKLGKLRRKFCKYCYSPKLRTKSVKRGIKTIQCESCGRISRWKVK